VALWRLKTVGRSEDGCSKSEIRYYTFKFVICTDYLVGFVTVVTVVKSRGQ
jgi:hypothetical protein